MVGLGFVYLLFLRQNPERPNEKTELRGVEEGVWV